MIYCPNCFEEIDESDIHWKCPFCGDEGDAFLICSECGTFVSHDGEEWICEYCDNDFNIQANMNMA